MNEPRMLPYEFRAFRQEDLIYLFDNSEDVYLCSISPAVWCECIQHVADDPDPWAYECSHYIDRRDLDKLETVLIETTDPDPDNDPDDDRISAWEHATEMVNCNNYGGLL